MRHGHHHIIASFECQRKYLLIVNNHGIFLANHLCVMIVGITILYFLFKGLRAQVPTFQFQLTYYLNVMQF